MKRFLAIVLLTMPAFAQITTSYDQEISNLKPIVHLTFSEAGGAFIDNASGIKWTNASTGAIAYQQLSLIPGHFANALTYNSSIATSNNSIGSFEWNQPFSIAIQFSGMVVGNASTQQIQLVNKGTLGADTDFCPATTTDRNGYYLFISGPSCTGSPGQTLCFAISASVSAGGLSTIAACGSLVVGDGNPHNAVVTYDGSGLYTGINMTIDGIPIGSAQKTWSLRGTYGAAIASTIISASPLAILNDPINNTGGGSNSLSDLAIFPTVISSTVGEDLTLFTQPWATVFSPAVCAAQPNVIAIDDLAGDPDNLLFITQMAFLQKQGCIHLIGIEEAVAGGPSAAFVRQILDEAGEADVMVSQVPPGVSCGGSNPNYPDGQSFACGSPTALLTSVANYDANWASRVATGVISDVQLYTNAFAKYSNINLVSGIGLQGIYDYIQTVAGGLATFQSKVTAIYQQENFCGHTSTISIQNLGSGTQAGEYMLANNGTVPIYFYGGDLSCTPGWDIGPIAPQFTRGANDPLAFYMNLVSPGVPVDRIPFDTWPLMGLMSPSRWQKGNSTGGTLVLSGTGATATEHWDFATNSNHFWMNYIGTVPTNSGNWLMPTTNTNPLFGRVVPQLSTPKVYPATPNLIAHWRTNEGTGTTLNDSVGSNTITGGTYGWGRVGVTAGIPIDGSYSYAAAPCSASALAITPSTPFSISFWFNIPIVTGNNIFVNTTIAANNGVWAQTVGDSKVNFAIGSSGGGLVYFPTATTLTAGVTYHALLTYDGFGSSSGMHIYENGTLSASGTGTTDITGTMIAGPLCLGAKFDGPSVVNNSVFNIEYYNVDESANAMAIYKGWQ